MTRANDRIDVTDRLRKVGFNLFISRGYNATGIQEITDLAQVPKGSFYNHFDSKEVFAAYVLQNYTDQVNAVFDQQVVPEGTEDVSAIVTEIFSGFMTYQIRNGGRGCLVGNLTSELADSSELCRQTLSTAIEGWHNRLATLIQRGQDLGQFRSDVTAERLAVLFWDAWEGAQMRMKVARDPHLLAETIHLLTERVLKNPTPTPSTEHLATML